MNIQVTPAPKRDELVRAIAEAVAAHRPVTDRGAIPSCLCGDKGSEASWRRLREHQATAISDALMTAIESLREDAERCGARCPFGEHETDSDRCRLDAGHEWRHTTASGQCSWSGNELVTVPDSDPHAGQAEALAADRDSWQATSQAQHTELMSLRHEVEVLTRERDKIRRCFDFAARINLRTIDEVTAQRDEARAAVGRVRALIQSERAHGDALTRCNLAAERFQQALDGPPDAPRIGSQTMQEEM